MRRIVFVVCTLGLLGCRSEQPAFVAPPPTVAAPSSTPAVPVGRFTLHAHQVASSDRAEEWQWKITGTPADSSGEGYSVTFDGEQPISTRFAPRGSQGFQCVISVRGDQVTPQTVQFTETARIGVGDSVRTQSSEWTESGVLSRVFHVLVKRDTKDELPKQLTLASIHGNPVSVRVGE